MMVGYLTWCTTRRDKTSVIANALEKNDAILTTSLTTIIKTYPWGHKYPIFLLAIIKLLNNL
jgi:hypothetical protein